MPDRRLKIICVDDEKLVLELTVESCKGLNGSPEVHGFSSVKKTLDYLESNEADIAILDINMPEMNGLQLAMKIKEKRPDTAVIFLTGYDEYALEAYKVHPVGYLMKPIDVRELQEQVDYAGNIQRGSDHTKQNKDRLAVVQTFGEFEVYAEGRKLSFDRGKSKELLAYLVDRQGGSITRKMAHGILWEDRQYDRTMQKQLDVVIRSLRDTLKRYGIEDIFLWKGER